MYGVPGSGKSAFARQFANELGISHINSNRIRYELNKHAKFTSTENNIVFQLSQYMSEELIKTKQPMIFDMNLPTRKLRDTIKKFAQDNKYEYLLVWMQIDIDTAVQRSSIKDHRKIDDKYGFVLSEQIFKNISEEMINPRPDTENFIVISGKHIFKKQYAVLINRLLKMGIIESLNQAVDKEFNQRFSQVRRQPNRTISREQKTIR